MAGLLIGLAVLIVAGGVLGSLSLLAHYGVLGTRSSSPAIQPIRGGTWMDDFLVDPDSFIPNGSESTWAVMVDQALYLPLFYGDPQGMIHPGAATEIPSLQNGDISGDGTTWTFHLRPHLVWSDGQPYDARDVDYTWRTWLDPTFGAGSTTGLNLITDAEVSADYLSITFHLKQAFAPFLSLWVDGFCAPLPAHYFSRVAPRSIRKSPDNLNPKVTSGPFMIEESVPGDHYTLVRNPRYYRASEGLPYLDKVVFRVVADQDGILGDLQAGAITSSWFLDLEKTPVYRGLTHYTLVTPPTSAGFEALWFNFHNTVLASHPEVRQAIAMAIDHPALIQQARHGFAGPLCDDHPSAYHLGLDQNCSKLNPAAANKLLDDHGWLKGSDGVRSKNGQRLEFEYSTTANNDWRSEDEVILQRNLQAIGIKLDIQNYSLDTFFSSFLPRGKASPPTGAVAGRYDIGEWENTAGWGYDPDDSSLFSCDQIPPKGQNFDFYCNSALDALFQQELVTVLPGLREQLFETIHQIYLTEFPFILLYSVTDIGIVRKGTHNYQLSPFNGETINIWEWWCDGGKC
jgi:peptide/nickel transport system substrate-binding protein